MGMYHIRSHLHFGTRLGDIPSECQVWRMGHDENVGCKKTSKLHHQPQAILANVQF